jgi:hypothetical protein
VNGADCYKVDGALTARLFYLSARRLRKLQDGETITENAILEAFREAIRDAMASDKFADGFPSLLGAAFGSITNANVTDLDVFGDGATGSQRDIDDSASAGAIAGGVIGGILGAALIMLAVVMWVRRDRDETKTRQLDKLADDSSSSSAGEENRAYNTTAIIVDEDDSLYTGVGMATSASMAEDSVVGRDGFAVYKEEEPLDSRRGPTFVSIKDDLLDTTAKPKIQESIRTELGTPTRTPSRKRDYGVPDTVKL